MANKIAIAESASPDEIFVLELKSILSDWLLTLDLRRESFNLLSCLWFRFEGFFHFPRVFLESWLAKLRVRCGTLRWDEGLLDELGDPGRDDPLGSPDEGDLRRLDPMMTWWPSPLLLRGRGAQGALSSTSRGLSLLWWELISLMTWYLWYGWTSGPLLSTSHVLEISLIILMVSWTWKMNQSTNISTIYWL